MTKRIRKKEKENIFKRAVSLLLMSFLLLLCACQRPEANADKPKEYIEATARVSSVGYYWKEESRGTELTILGETDDYYLAKLDGTQVYVEQSMVTPQISVTVDDDSYTCLNHTKVYDSAYLTGTVLLQCTEEDEIRVLDQWNGVSYVSANGQLGYVSTTALSRKQTQEVSQPIPDIWEITQQGTGPAEQQKTQDGGEINLSPTSFCVSNRFPFIMVAYAKTKETKTIFSDHTKLYLGFTVAGESLMVTDSNESEVSVYYQGKNCTLPRWSVRLQEDDGFSSWIGYAVKGGKLFSNKDFSGDITILEENQKITVLYALDEDTLFVEVDGKTGFILSSNVQKEKSYSVVVKEEEKQKEIEVTAPGWSGNESWDDSNSSATNEQQDTTQAWTEPVL